jgi:hypothetical protein
MEVDGMPGSNTEGSKSKRGPETEVVTTKVTVAFPFSQIKLQEPSEDLAAVAALVRELAELLAEVAPGPQAQDLEKRARAMANRLA